ncbi:hypothetical protein EAF04_005571 [Stromatinia cepivora]|nr:hypothetical protein EAF04_005571 [Stromatinia cepivora]
MSTKCCLIMAYGIQGLLARPNPNVTSQQASNNSFTIPTQGWTSSPSVEDRLTSCGAVSSQFPWHDILLVEQGADVATAITLDTRSTMFGILKDAENVPIEMYERSPLDINMRIVFAPQKLPFDRLENTDWRELKRGGQIVFFLMTMAYSALFITAWNSHFPTDSERVMWRIASLSITATIPLYFIITAFAYEVFPALVQYFNPAKVSDAGLQAQKISPQPLSRCELDDNLDKGTATQSVFKRESGASTEDHVFSQPLTMYKLEIVEICSEEPMPSQALSKKELSICSKEAVSILPEKCSRLSRIAASLRNNSISKNPSLYIPLKAAIPMYAIAFLYCSSRTVIVILDLIQLRSLPQNAFDTVNWGSFVPHIS